MIQTSRFHSNCYHNSASVRLPYTTNDSRVITRFALDLCERLFRPDYQYAKAGVCLYELSNRSYSQFDFFEPGQPNKAFALMAVIDKVNQKYGNGHVF